MDAQTSVKYAKKQVRLLRVQTALIAILLVIVLLAGLFLALKFREVSSVVDTVRRELETVDFEAINNAADSFAEAAEKLDELDMDGFDKTVDSLRAAADKIGSVDAGELNEAVAALKAAAENLSDIDIASLNSLVEALDGTATKLSTAVNAIGGIFGR